MCYSAQIWADYRKYVRMFGADMGIREFVELFFHRATTDSKVQIPKAMEVAFENPQTEYECQIKAAIAEFNAAQAGRLEQELFKQRKRLADAERSLQVKPTKAAAESKRIAGDKVEWTMGKLGDLRRIELTDEDSRIFPGHYAPVMVMENGRRVVKPMRFQCRPAGKPAFYDKKFPGTYNARRDNLEGFWRELFGFSHGIMVVNAFYENVSRHRIEGRELQPGEAEQNVVLEFKPRPAEDMLVACLWSRWSGEGHPDLLSFAAITDGPPPEIAAAGHDRCIVPIKPEHVDAWLSPDRTNLARQFAILDDRATPFYEHKLAA